jgi:hypothetical protein
MRSLRKQKRNSYILRANYEDFRSSMPSNPNAVTALLDPKLIENIEREAKTQHIAKSKVIAICVERYFNPPDGNEQKITDLESSLREKENLIALHENTLRNKEEIISRLEDDKGHLWLEFSEMRKATERYLLLSAPKPPRRSLKEWLFGKKQREEGA